MTCRRCKVDFCCILLRQKYCAENCIRKNCFCIQCQIHNNSSQKSTDTYEDCLFPSECYSYDYINGYSYFLRHFCTDHCQNRNCLHREKHEVVGQLHDGTTTEKVDIREQWIGPEECEDRESSIPAATGVARMVPRVPKKARIRQKRILATYRARRRDRASSGRTRGPRNDRSESALSAAAVIRTRRASGACYRGMQ
jgi:hypothetical protein